MDKGEMVRKAIKIVPAVNGGYVVLPMGQQFEASGPEHSMAFTNYRDLLGFLNEDYTLANQTPTGHPEKAEQ